MTKSILLLPPCPASGPISINGHQFHPYSLVKLFKPYLVRRDLDPNHWTNSLLESVSARFSWVTMDGEDYSASFEAEIPCGSLKKRLEAVPVEKKVWQKQGWFSSELVVPEDLQKGIVEAWKLDVAKAGDVAMKKAQEAFDQALQDWQNAVGQKP